MTQHVAVVRRGGLTLATLTLAGALLLALPTAAHAAIVDTVPLGSAANYSVLGGSGVSNAHNNPVAQTTMHQNLGVSPGSSVTGFPPGQVLAPGVRDDPGAAAAQISLTAGYLNAFNRATLTGVTTTELGGKTLVGGVYAATTEPKGPLGLTGTLTLDGQGNPNTVWIFQTGSTLTTASASHVNLIGGAQECNVFWQVASIATLGSDSTFVGNILGSDLIAVNSNVTVHGRALAQTQGAVTLIDDHFTTPTCATSLPGPSTSTTLAAAPATTVPAASTTTVPGIGTTTTSLGLTVGIVGPPRTGVAPLPANTFPWPPVLAVGAVGVATAGLVTRRRVRRHAAPPGH